LRVGQLRGLTGYAAYRGCDVRDDTWKTKFMKKVHAAPLTGLEQG
jgi:hypothetical protein